MGLTSFALHDLGWHAFQQLCHTILREILGQTVTSFLDTNDGGRDGTFTGRWIPEAGTVWEGEFVVQCKHTARPGHTLTVSQLREEFNKVEALAAAGRCDVYLLMTNAGVTGETERLIVTEVARRGVKHVAVYSSTWFNQQISEHARLRRLVPRLYGLGDLTQILDDRAYRQARAVLDSMRPDLAKLVLTGTYHRAVRALADNSFVLLLGAPSAGKTTIAAQLALGTADEFETAVVKLDTIGDLQDRWNPDERQLFWLDDAFGATQFERFRASSWTTATPRVAGAIDAGSMFVLTSRDYVLRAARRFLKVGAFPLLNESQVVVDVADLTGTERRQILYNHLRHGGQPNVVVAQMQPHLEDAADHPGFTPELARRLANPIFTAQLRAGDPGSIADFFARPSTFLHDVMLGLGTDAQAALGLIFIHHNWLPSPIQVTDESTDLLTRLGSDLGGVTQALDTLKGSLVENITRDGQQGWVFAHPTMVDAYADLLRTPELLHHFITGFPLDVLLREVTCGDVGLKGAVVVPTPHYRAMLNRLDEPLPSDGEARWRTRDRRTTFLATRCDRAFLEAWLARNPLEPERLADPGLMLEADVDNELAARLIDYRLFPEHLRSKFVKELIEYCVTGVDPAVLWNERLRSTLSEAEYRTLLERVRTELLADPHSAIFNHTQGWDSSSDHGSPESAVEGLRTLVEAIPDLFPADPSMRSAAARLDRNLDDWVNDQEWDEPSSGRRSPDLAADATMSPATTSDRSVFDDLLNGRDARRVRPATDSDTGRMEPSRRRQRR